MKRENLKRLRELQKQYREEEERMLSVKEFNQAYFYMGAQQAVSMVIFQILENEGVED